MWSWHSTGVTVLGKSEGYAWMVCKEGSAGEVVVNLVGRP